MNRKRTVIVVVVTAIIAAIAGFLVWSQSASQGTVTTSYKSNKPIADKQLDGRYFKLTYPGRYAIKKVESTNPRDLEVYTLTADTVYDKRLIVTVVQLPSGRLDDESGYKLRQAHSDEYTAETKPFGDDTATIMSKRDGSERTIFVPHRGKLLTLSFVTDPANDTGLAGEAEVVLGGFTWKD